MVILTESDLLKLYPNPKNVKNIKIQNSNITEIDLIAFVQYKYLVGLDLSKNKITKIQGLEELEYLDGFNWRTKEKITLPMILDRVNLPTSVKKP
jgi:hypothetical protein